MMNSYACCRLASGRVGMTSEADCAQFVGSTWIPNVACDNDNDFIVIRYACMLYPWL